MVKDVLGFLNENYGAAIVIAVVLFLGVVSFKGDFSFDLNKFLESRKKKNLTRAQNYCPHMDISFDSKKDTMIYQSWFESPVSTTKWFCRCCGAMRYSNDEKRLKREAAEFFRDEKLYKKRLRKYNRYAKKAM